MWQLMNSLLLTAVEALSAALFIALAAVTVHLRQLRRGGRRTEVGSDHAVPSVGLLHPNAGGGGGGERVLWVALATLMAADQRSGISRQYVLYTKRYPAPGAADATAASEPQGDPLTSGRRDASPTSRSAEQLARDERDTSHLLALVRQQFNLYDFDPKRLTVVYLERTWLLEPRYYPRLTLFLQSIVGGVAVFWDVASRGATDVVVDTVGVPCSYWLLYLLCGSTVAAYVHYPVISTDMVAKVQSRTASYNNSGTVARSGFLTRIKVWYYRSFALVYRLLGGNFATVVMTNSTWTNNHVQRMWRRTDTSIVYPPCGIARLLEAVPDLSADERDLTIVSVGQFRPEKDHPLQLRAFARLLKSPTLPAEVRTQVKLICVGGCRDQGDHDRVASLEALAKSLGIGDRVEFRKSVPASHVVDLLGRASVGLHTMRDEHFGIVVAEYQAAGAVAVAHNSAGPKQDIVREGTGFLATTEEEYALCMERAIKLRLQQPQEWRKLVQEARRSANRFSDKFFARAFITRLAPVLALTLLPEEDDDGVKLCC
jgi:alpha-1,2-mannosyltransferase